MVHLCYIFFIEFRAVVLVEIRALLNGICKLKWSFVNVWSKFFSFILIYTSKCDRSSSYSSDCRVQDLRTGWLVQSNSAKFLPRIEDSHWNSVYNDGCQDFHLFPQFFSSAEPKVLRVSYCDRAVSVVWPVLSILHFWLTWSQHAQGEPLGWYSVHHASSFMGRQQFL